MQSMCIACTASQDKNFMTLASEKKSVIKLFKLHFAEGIGYSVQRRKFIHIIRKLNFRPVGLHEGPVLW